MLKLLSFFAVSYFGFKFLVTNTLGANGIFGNFIAESPWIVLSIYIFVITHITITCMSLSFHRYHTHKGVVLNKWIDYPMQTWLWMVTSMSKVDWVAVHIWHHAHSDQEKDPHSPVQNGLLHGLFLGVFDYTKAKSWPEIEKIKKTIPTNGYEKFIYNNSFTGPYFMSVFAIVLFGPTWGGVVALLNFMVSPVFAIGGVNAIAHWWGYRNHITTDNSRNIGYIFPLNFMVCGEMDHNNHHGHMRSCSFRHRWYEFDVGYMYIKMLQAVKLADIKNAYTPKTLKQEFSKKLTEFIESDEKFRKRCEELAQEMKISYQELMTRIEAYFRGEKVKMDNAVQEFMDEVRMKFKAHFRQLAYA